MHNTTRGAIEKSPSEIASLGFVVTESRDHADALEGLSRLPSQVGAPNGGAPLAGVVKTGEERKQGRLAGPVGAQEDHEFPTAQAETDVVEGQVCGIAEAQSGDVEGRVGRAFDAVMVRLPDRLVSA